MIRDGDYDTPFPDVDPVRIALLSPLSIVLTTLSGGGQTTMAASSEY